MTGLAYERLGGDRIIRTPSVLHSHPVAYSVQFRNHDSCLNKLNCKAVKLLMGTKFGAENLFVTIFFDELPYCEE